MWLLIPAALAAPERCNGVDDDGDGQVDEGPVAWALDADGDGDGDERLLILTESCALRPAGAVAATTDCDDQDPAVHAGAPEACNGRDDDCDGLVDQGGACACDVSAGAGSTFQACTTPVDWFQAADRCAIDGYHLVSIDSQAVQDAVEALVLPFGVDFWMGLEDQAAEGVYVWADGTPLTYQNYRMGEPNDWEMREDCTELERNTGLWDDQACESLEAYVCELECTPATWYRDVDGDGLGDPNATLRECGRPPGAVANAADCDDARADQPAVFYEDRDGDGVGGDVLGIGCGGAVLVGGDCDDDDRSIVDCEPLDTGIAPTDPTAPTGPGDTGTPPVPGDTGTPPAPDDPSPHDDAPPPPAAGPHAPPEPEFGFGLGCASLPGPGGLLAAALAALGMRRRG